MLIYIITIILHHNIQFMMILKNRSFITHSCRYNCCHPLWSILCHFILLIYVTVSRGWKVKKKKCQSLSCIWIFATPWTIASQAPLSMEFSRQEYWSGLPFPSPGDLPHPGIELRSPALQMDSLPSVSSSMVNFISIYFINFCDQSQESTFPQR